MSYHPSHRKPPRQERWPNATPQEGWPAYLGGDGYRDGDQAWGATGEFAGARNGYAATGGYGDPGAGYPGGGYPGGGNGYGGHAGTYDGYAGVRGGYPAAGDGFDGAPDGLARADGGYGAGGGYGGMADEYARGATSHPWNEHDGAESGYGDARNGYDGYDAARAGHGDAWDGYGGQDGSAGARDGFASPAGYLNEDGFASPAGYLDEDGYPEPSPSASSRSSGPLLIAPDTFEEPGWLPGRSEGPVREPGRGGLIIGAVTGFLAAAVAIGVATLAAAFVRPQASPVIAVGGAFIDRTPPALKNFAVEHFGENDKTVLLLGMYVTIALIAMAIGCLARRTVTIGVAGLAAFGLFGAFVAITRPEGRVSDVIPSVIGAIAGIAALLWLTHCAAPVGSWRPAYGGRRRA